MVEELKKAMAAMERYATEEAARPHPTPLDLDARAREMLDAFYGAAPEKFGTTLSDDRQLSVAASIPLCEEDRIWLRAISAVLTLARPSGDIDKLLWHVEQVMGPISTQPCEVPGDDDRSILEHNFRALLDQPTRTPTEALRCAIRHIEHMAAWIGKQSAGYSFESLGEDMPGIAAALAERPVVDEHAEFQKWASNNWQNSLPPHNAWIGWEARAAILSPPSASVDARGEAMDFQMIHDLIQEAKGGARGTSCESYVTNHLDDAEHHLYAIEDALNTNREG